MSEKNKNIARGYFDALINGGLPDSLVTDDFQGWTTLAGATDGKSYQHMTRLLRVMCPDHLKLNILSLTAEEDRVVAEVESEATLLDGTPYANTYIFVFRIRDGLIASVAEHFNAVTVIEKMVPLMKQLPR